MARAGGADREAGRLVIGRLMISRRGALALGFAAAAASPVRAQTPPRIVSVGSSLTEIVYTLGAENLLAGVDSTSLFPAAARALPQVGYMRALSAEGVLALKPTLIMATTAAGPAATLDQLRSTGIEVLVLPDHYDYDSVIGKIAAVGKVTGKAAEAEARRRAQPPDLKRRAEEATPLVKKYVSWGAGPRASQYLILGAKARAAMDGRAMPDLEDVNAMAIPVLSHRVVMNFQAEAEGMSAERLVAVPARP